jgi:hypothetical protein
MTDSNPRATDARPDDQNHADGGDPPDNSAPRVDAHAHADAGDDADGDGGHTDDDAEFADPDDLKVSRDADGDLLPEVIEAGGYGKVKMRPMNYGMLQDKFGDGTSADLAAGDLADLFDRHVLRPDLSADAGGTVTAGYVRDLEPLAPRELLLALLDVSGIDADVEMDDDGGASVDVTGDGTDGADERGN